MADDCRDDESGCGRVADEFGALSDAAHDLFTRRGTTKGEAYGASYGLFLEMLDLVLSHTAGADETVRVKDWLVRHLDLLALHVKGWQPGRPTEIRETIHQTFKEHADSRVH